ncbi:hypothetical protein [Bradyrhizobium sp. BRP22]|nr:hypothetical protein [Bradyrhizobium sp. BRP22]
MATYARFTLVEQARAMFSNRTPLLDEKQRAAAARAFQRRLDFR